MEPLCRGVANEVARKEDLVLEEIEYEDALDFLLVQAHVVHQAFDPARKVPWRLYAYGNLRFDLIDFWRSAAGFGARGQHRVARSDPGERNRLEHMSATTGGEDPDSDRAGPGSFARILDDRSSRVRWEKRRLGFGDVRRDQSLGAEPDHEQVAA